MREIHASSLHRVMACLGSITLPRSTIPHTSEIAREGTAAHEVFAARLTGQPVPEVSADGWVITPEMIDSLDSIVDRIKSRYPPTGVMCEIDASWTTYGGTRILGRLDACQFDGNILYIDDLKYGWRIVEPFENMQLLSYAIGTCVQQDIAPGFITLSIHQPNPWHPEGESREWTITYDQMIDYKQLILERFDHPDESCRSGPHCAYCDVADCCPSSRLAALNAVDISMHALPEYPTGSQIAFELSVLERAHSAIKFRLDALTVLAESKLRAGTPVGNLALVQQYGNTAWLDSVTPEMVESLSGIDVRKQSMITPTQAKKAGVDKTLIEALSERPYKGVKLVKQDLNKTAMKYFGKGSE